MITLLLVCIFIGINVRLYLNIDKFNIVVEVILPLHLSVISLRLNLYNKTLFYNINGGVDKEIVIKNSKKKPKKQFKKIRIDRINFSLILGSKEDCLTGLYTSKVIEYLTDLFVNISENYIEIQNYDKLIIPDFNSENTKLIVNIIINKGIIDIIKNVFAKSEKREVKYAN